MKFWEVLKAAEEGKTLQFNKEGKGWKDWDQSYIKNWSQSSFEKADYEVRIKPEPVVFYRNQYKTGWCSSYSTKEEAINSAGHDAIRVAVKFVEVEE